VIEAKAHRLLVAGRVAVMYADAHTLVAEVEGDHGRYVVRVDAGRARCPCPAWRPCSHALAVELVAGDRVRRMNKVAA
jgi:uncharacterized Zn finger protein